MVKCRGKRAQQSRLFRAERGPHTPFLHGVGRRLILALASLLGQSYPELVGGGERSAIV